MKTEILNGLHWPIVRQQQQPAPSDTVFPVASSRLSRIWNPHRWLRAQGWPGVLGIGLLAMCAAFYFSTLRPAELRLQEAQQSAIAMQEQIRQSSQDMTHKRRSASEQLTDFYRLFPNEKELPARLGRIFAAAQEQGLVLEQGEYKTSRDKSGRLTRYEITLPVKGEYPQIRRFLINLSNDVPVVGLMHVQFERQKIATALIDAKIKLAIYLD